MSRQERLTRRSRRHGLVGSLREGASDVVQSVVNEVVPGVVGALDVDEVVQRVDVQAILDRIDMEDLIERIDLNALLEHLDVDALLARVDVQALVKRLDVGQIIDEIDVNALLERVDVDALVERTELGDIVARSGAGVAAKGLDVARSLGVGADSFVHRWADRLLRRDPAFHPGGPVLLIGHARTQTSPP